MLSSLPPWLWITLVCLGALLGTVAYLILLERKVASWVQDRIGPNRVGPRGLFQPLADGLKFFLKEDYRPAGVDRWLFSIAPAVMMVVVLVAVAVIPWGGVLQRTVRSDQSAVPAGAQVVQDRPLDGGARGAREITYRYPFQIARLDIGVLFIVAVLSLAVYGVVVGGWASNNKYSFLGGLRATAQMISYEIPLGLSILTVALMHGTLDLAQIVQAQATYWAGFIPAWNVFAQPLAFVLFLVCIHAEANRAPFDLAEAEQELVGGYHTEYSAMRFAFFFLAEYFGMIVTSAVCVALFFGGWHLPGLGGNVDPAAPAVTTSLTVCILRSFVFFAKTMVIIFIFMWVRWSLPRFRFDQLLMLAWRALIPIALGILMATAIVIWAAGSSSEVYRLHLRLGGGMALAMLLANLIVLAAAVALSLVLPAPPATNRRVVVEGSRFAAASEKVVV